MSNVDSTILIPKNSQITEDSTSIKSMGSSDYAIQNKEKHKSTVKVYLRYIVIYEYDYEVTFDFFDGENGLSVYKITGMKTINSQCCSCKQSCNTYCIHFEHLKVKLQMPALKPTTIFGDKISFLKIVEKAKFLKSSHIPMVPEVPPVNHYLTLMKEKHRKCDNKICNKEIKTGDLYIFTFVFPYCRETQTFLPSDRKCYHIKQSCFSDSNQTNMLRQIFQIDKATGKWHIFFNQNLTVKQKEKLESENIHLEKMQNCETLPTNVNLRYYCDTERYIDENEI